MKKIFLLFIVIVLFNGCNLNEERKKVVGIEDTLSNSYQKKIFLPDSLVFFYGGKKRKIATDEYFNKTVKVLSILGNDCSKCTVSELMYWDDLSRNYENIDSIQLILVYSGPNYYFTDVLSEDIGIQIPVLLDESSTIQNNNRLFEDPLYRTVLLDKDNKILLIGSFLNNMNLRRLYFEEIEKQLSK